MSITNPRVQSLVVATVSLSALALAFAACVGAGIGGIVTERAQTRATHAAAAVHVAMRGADADHPSPSRTTNAVEASVALVQPETIELPVITVASADQPKPRAVKKAQSKTVWASIKGFFSKHA